MKNVWIQRILYVCLLALGLGLTIWLFSEQDLTVMEEIMAYTRWEWVALSLVVTLTGHWIRAQRWALLLKGSHESVSTKETFVALMTGYFVNLGIPRLGEATRCLSLHRLAGTPVMKSAGTVLVERVFDLICLALILGGTVFAAKDKVGHFFKFEIAKPLVGKFEGKEIIIIAAVVLLAIGAVSLYFFLRLKLGQKWLAWIQDQAGKMRDGLLSVLYMPGKWKFLLYTLLIWVSYFSAPFFSLYALGMANEQAVLVGFVAFVVGSVARTLPVPAGGIGAYQWFVMQAMIVFGYTQEEGLSLAMLNFSVQTLFYIVFGILSFVLLGLWGRKRI